MFVGREKELAMLETEWEQPGFRMPVIYGRRRVGKTAILEKFSKERDILFFTPGLDAKRNVADLKKVMMSHGFEPRSQDMRGLLEEIFDASAGKRIGLIIDEFPYLATCDPDLTASIQRTIDKKKERSNLFLLLCGSSISFMKDHVLGYESPLFGRRTSQYGITPFTIFDAAKFFPQTTFEEICKIYGMVDGTPHYLGMMTENNFDNNLRKNFLVPSSYLFEEAMRLMRQELRKPELYHAMLETISTGPKKRADVISRMNALGIDNEEALRMIDDLVKVEVVRAGSPLGGSMEKKCSIE